MKRRSLTLSAAALALAPLLGHAQQAFPDKPITFVVPFAAGTATDQIARALGNSITAETKQPVVIDNRAGASGFIASQQVAKAAADGYTVLITTNTTHAANEHLFKKLPYDPVKDFSPITALGKGGQIMVVNPSFPAKSVAEFVALAKKEPGKYSFGSGSSSSRMAGELLQQMADIKLLHVPYKSNTLAVTDLLGRADPHDDHRRGHRPAAGEGRQAARAGGVERGALTVGTRCAHHFRSRREGL